MARGFRLYEMLTGTNISAVRRSWLGGALRRGSVSYIVLAVLSAALIRLAIACVYSRRIYWDE